MERIRRLLVALDLTPDRKALTSGSQLAVENAIALIPDRDREVVLFHSTASDDAWNPATDQYEDLPEGTPEARRPVLESTLARFRDAGIPTELEVTTEPPVQGIVRRVLREDVGLVLAGKRNEFERAGHRLGTVSTKLLRNCPCPVWVVKPDVAPMPRRVLAATDLTAVGGRVVEAATLVVEHCDSDLHVVHAFQLPISVQKGGPEASARFEREQREECRRRIEQQLADAKCTRKAEIHIGLTSPTQAILACVERLDPDLVVMGTVSRGGVAGLLVGNTAERLVNRLDCSLLAVKPEDFVCPIPVD